MAGAEGPKNRRLKFRKDIKQKAKDNKDITGNYIIKPSDLNKDSHTLSSKLREKLRSLYLTDQEILIALNDNNIINIDDNDEEKLNKYQQHYKQEIKQRKKQHKKDIFVPQTPPNKITSSTSISFNTPVIKHKQSITTPPPSISFKNNSISTLKQFAFNYTPTVPRTKSNKPTNPPPKWQAYMNPLINQYKPHQISSLIPNDYVKIKLQSNNLYQRLQRHLWHINVKKKEGRWFNMRHCFNQDKANLKQLKVSSFYIYFILYLFYFIFISFYIYSILHLFHFIFIPFYFYCRCFIYIII